MKINFHQAIVKVREDGTEIKTDRFVCVEMRMDAEIGIWKKK